MCKQILEKKTPQFYQNELEKLKNLNLSVRNTYVLYQFKKRKMAVAVNHQRNTQKPLTEINLAHLVI